MKTFPQPNETRWQRAKRSADNGDYNVIFLLLFFGVLPGALNLLALWLEQ